MSVFPESLVRKHGRVHRDKSFPNPLVGTSYLTVGLKDNLTVYSVIGEHSNCDKGWRAKALANATPWDDLTTEEKKVLTWEVEATYKALFGDADEERVS